VLPPDPEEDEGCEEEEVDEVGWVEELQE